MRKLGLVLLALIACLAAYLLFWPVPIAPVAWDAPEDRGYVGVFAPNTALSDLELLDMGEEGPEDIAIRDDRLYTSTQSGLILTYDLADGTVREFADTGGIPLGIEFDAEGRLLVADAALGLLRIDGDGEVETLLDTIDGTPIAYADDVDSGPDGVIYFSDASTKFGAVANGGTMAASLLEISEHAGTGRVIAYDPASGESSIIADGLSFPNGVAMSADGAAVLVNVTGDYNTLRIPVDGTSRAGGITEFAANYPGFPDNINPGPDVDGAPTYIVGLVSPRSRELDAMSSRPWLRKMVFRLPESLRISASDYTHIVVLDADGTAIASMQDPAGTYAQVTGGIVHNGQLYLSSLTEHSVAKTAAPSPLN